MIFHDIVTDPLASLKL